MRVVSTALVAAWFMLASAGWVWASVLPVGQIGSLAVGSASSGHSAAGSSSPLAQLASGTKKFFVSMKNALTPKSHTRTTKTRYYTPGTTPKYQSEPQKPWYTTWLHTKESSKK